MSQACLKYASVPNHIWELSHVGDCRSFHIEKHDSHDATVAPHTHNFIQIYYINSGQMRHSVLDSYGNVISSALLTAGDIFILPPRFYHKLSMFADDLSYTSVCFSPEFIFYDFQNVSYFSGFINHLLTTDAVNIGAIPKSIVTLKGAQGEVSTLLHMMEEEYANKKNGFLTYIKGDLLKLLVIIARRYCEDQAQTNDAAAMNLYYESIRRSINYVDENFHLNLKIDDVAKMFFVSRTYFCTLFKRMTGQTFYAYINRLRLNQAKDLMLKSDYSVFEVAQRSGFNDISTYYRQFKRTYGIPPSLFRKTVRSAEEAQ